MFESRSIGGAALAMALATQPAFAEPPAKTALPTKPAAPAAKPAAAKPAMPTKPADQPLKPNYFKPGLKLKKQDFRKKHKMGMRGRVASDKKSVLDRARARSAARRVAPREIAVRYREEVRLLLDRTFGGRPLPTSAKAALKAHARRTAQLDRIEALALKAGDEATIVRVEKLRAAQRANLAARLRAEQRKASTP